MPLGILIARGRIWSYDRLVHVRPLILRQQRAGNRQTRDIVLVGQGEAEFLRVGADLLDAFELQVNEALTAACEGCILRRRG